MLGFITPPCGLYEPSCVLVLQTQRAARGTARFVLMAPVDRKQRDYLSLLELVPAVVLAALGLSRALRFQR